MPAPASSTGAISGVVLARVAGSYIEGVGVPDILPTLLAAVLLIAAAVLASFIPAVRAARVDVMQALRSE